MSRWKMGDTVAFIPNPDEVMFGTIREITEIEGRDTLYGIRWDDGFEDGVGNIFPEWELNDIEEELDA